MALKPCFNYANLRLTVTNIRIDLHEFAQPLQLEIDWLLTLSKGKSIAIKLLILLLSSLKELNKILRITVVAVRPRQHTLVFAE